MASWWSPPPREKGCWRRLGAICFDVLTRPGPLIRVGCERPFLSPLLVLITPAPEEAGMGWETVRVGHFNLWRENKKAQVDLEQLLPKVDVLTLNEAARHYIAIEKACGDKFGFVHAKDMGYNARQNVILYRKSVFRESEVPAAAELMCDSTAGTPERYMLAKRLQHRKTKRVLKVRSTHMNSHVENPKWRDLPRWKQYTQHLWRLRRSLAFHRGGEVVQHLGMDCNVNYRRRAVRVAPVLPYAALRTVRARCSYAVLGTPGLGTKGRRLIDAVWLMRSPYARFVRQQIITGLNSDHNAVVVTLEIR